MSILNINPFPVIFDLDGNVLSAGFIYIGQPNLDPRYNAKTVYYDSGLTLPVDQSAGIPVLNGRVWNAGNPINLFIAGTYSIMILDQNGALVQPFAPIVTPF